jgi:phospholipid N-methyltransferase
LAELITSQAHLEDANVVVEYGPGTGVFTRQILPKLKPGATFFALELDRVLHNTLRQRLPEASVYCDSVANVGKYLRQHSTETADCIISGLPWASFNAEYQEELLEATLSVLAKGGRFLTFAYLQGLLLPTGRSFRRKLLEAFMVVRTSRVVWRNLPPAFVYQCIK